MHSEEQYEKLEKVYKRKCAVPHIGEMKNLIVNWRLITLIVIFNRSWISARRSRGCSWCYRPELTCLPQSQEEARGVSAFWNAAGEEWGCKIDDLLPCVDACTYCGDDFYLSLSLFSSLCLCLPTSSLHALTHRSPLLLLLCQTTIPISLTFPPPKTTPPLSTPSTRELLLTTALTLTSGSSI